MENKDAMIEKIKADSVYEFEVVLNRDNTYQSEYIEELLVEQMMARHEKHLPSPATTFHSWNYEIQDIKKIKDLKETFKITIKVNGYVFLQEDGSECLIQYSDLRDKIEGK